MFLNGHGGYDGGGQVASGDFLIVFQEPNSTERRPALRALVRRVRLSQCGHFMMGSAQIAGKHTTTLSGAYGADGLPNYFTDGQEHLWDRLHPIPQHLQDAFWDGGGHNTAGEEGPAFQTWGRANLKRLKHLLPAT